MVLQSSKKVEENLAGDLERFDQVPLLEDGVGDAGQRLLVSQLGDSEHVDAPLFRILQDLKRIKSEENQMTNEPKTRGLPVKKEA